jgi:curli biogenesis system outer membrane secretion channel CsgG
MKTKVLLAILVLIFSASLFSCYENKKVAVLPFNKGYDVPDNVASLARRIVTDDITKRKKFDLISTALVDQGIAETDAADMSSLMFDAAYLGADIMITGNIELVSPNKESAFDKLVGSVKDNSKYKVDVSCIDVMKDTVIASFSETYDAELKKMKKNVKKLKLGGRKATW